jgi:hypothetical protein
MAKVARKIFFIGLILEDEVQNNLKTHVKWVEGLPHDNLIK